MEKKLVSTIQNEAFVSKRHFHETRKKLSLAQMFKKQIRESVSTIEK